MNVKALNYEEIIKKIENNNIKSNLDDEKKEEESIPLRLLIDSARILSQKYDILVTNPPYMGGRGMDKPLSDFLSKNYKDNKSDLFSAFVEKSFSLCKENGQAGFLTPYVWMFIKSYLKLRENIIENKHITSLIQFEYSAFEEATVPICTFTFKNKKENATGTYLKLSDFRGGMKVQEIKTLESINNENCEYLYEFNQNNFLNIPGYPIAFWVEPELINAFRVGKKLSDIADVKVGLQTGNNDNFLRFWHEVDINNIGFGMKDFRDAKNSHKKWFPYNKGGDFRKWYGNQDYVVNWEDDGFEIRNFKDKNGKLRSRPQNTDFYFKESISWSKISSGNIAFRYFPNGFLFDVAGCSIFTEEDKKYIMGFLNSKPCSDILDAISPTLNYEVGHISSLPLIFSEEHKREILENVESNIELSRNEWNNFELSWNFKTHPFLQSNEKLISKAYENWSNSTNSIFYKLMENENSLNNIFSEIYGLNMEDNEIKESNIAFRNADLERDVKSFLSYFVGVLFGRYSLDEEGLFYAGGEFNTSNYSYFIENKCEIPDKDNIIPILDTAYFEDDIIDLFVKFLKLSFGEDTVEENIRFIANSLGNNGKTYRETIRKYFLNDFYNDHLRNYKNVPIYWLFDSGKENGFKALIYIHRYNSDTVARVRTDYLHKTQKSIEIAISINEQTDEEENNKSKNNDKNGNSNNKGKENNNLTKEITKLKKQLEETRKYDEALDYIANQQIVLDLDDGVKVNYKKFQNIEVENKKINLLKKINS
ncbi:MAG: BREX-1 system adenine-specific DNA-methyltransferase PglX [Methanobrevibacter sp.]|nr:BREX-1 system adenine-specific DNA-methyltransferase PglX [Candidatus Methanoflexus mossambicus]